MFKKSTAPSAGGYTLSKSLRFRASASAYLNRTPGSASNRTTWTWSGWVKRGQSSASTTNQILFGCATATNNYFQFGFDSGASFTASSAAECLGYVQVSGGNTYNISTNAVFRDYSAWYHIVFAFDTTQATDTNRVKIYVNGIQQTINQAAYPPQNTNMLIDSTIAHGVGYANVYSNYFDGYMANVQFIDGSALTPSSFGATDATTGAWQPIAYTGSYGTNGFYLPFTDATSTSTLGNDSSGNSNTWTVNNISVTAGATYDSMTDVPTLTSATASNYAVLNPLDSTLTLINANLSWSAPSNTELGSRGTIGVSSGKWYYEYKITSATANPFSLIGWASQSQNNNSVIATGTGPSTWAYYAYDFKTYNNGTASSVYGVTGSVNDIIMVALDLDNSRIYWGRNGTWFSSGNPATQTNPAYTNVSGTLFPWIQEYNQTSSINFGQRPFSYSAPSGYVALNTYNL